MYTRRKYSIEIENGRQAPWKPSYILKSLNSGFRTTDGQP